MLAAMELRAAEQSAAAAHDELTAAQARASAMLEENQGLRDTLAAVDLDDLYFFLQQKLDNNYEIVAALEKRAIEVRVDMERDAKNHAKKMRQLELVHEKNAAEAKEQANEARELLARMDPAEKLEGVKQEAPLKKLEQQRLQLQRQRIRAKHQLRKRLAAESHDAVLAATRVYDGVAGRVLDAYTKARCELAASGKRATALDRECERLTATETALKTQVDLALSTLQVAKQRAKKDDERLQAIHELGHDARPKPAPVVAKTVVREQRRKRVPRRTESAVDKFADAVLACVECIILVLTRALAKDDDDEFLRVAAGSTSRWPVLAAADPATRQALLRHLVAHAHVYRVGLCQLKNKPDQLNRVHALSETALRTATLHARPFITQGSPLEFKSPPTTTREDDVSTLTTPSRRQRPSRLSRKEDPETHHQNAQVTHHRLPQSVVLRWHSRTREKCTRPLRPCQFELPL